MSERQSQLILLLTNGAPLFRNTDQRWSESRSPRVGFRRYSGLVFPHQTQSTLAIAPSTNPMQLGVIRRIRAAQQGDFSTLPGKQGNTISAVRANEAVIGLHGLEG
jgi:hypothetical protein